MTMAGMSLVLERREATCGSIDLLVATLMV